MHFVHAETGWVVRAFHHYSVGAVVPGLLRAVGGGAPVRLGRDGLNHRATTLQTTAHVPWFQASMGRRRV